MTKEAGHEVSRHSVVVEEQGALAIIRLNRPKERNPLSVVTLTELDAAFSTLAAHEKIKAIIFTGAGDIFASGANIRELQALTPATAREFAERGQRLFQKISDARQLTIAAINGYCMGGGLDLALACAVRCAATAAVLAHPGARFGIITGWGGTQRLHRLVGTARAIEMFTTTRRLNAREALEIGLVDLLEDSALEGALRIAHSQCGAEYAPEDGGTTS
ncbi:MAG: enoyl-CoA hydratase/isomerase family protein [Acidobacteria bacterium]|nr:enoyl-CoA hydratase/isomerase family protein [Acidobacteriota bacterium]